jgi:hypothetical protein
MTATISRLDADASSLPFGEKPTKWDGVYRGCSNSKTLRASGMIQSRMWHYSEDRAGTRPGGGVKMDVLLRKVSYGRRGDLGTKRSDSVAIPFVRSNINANSV